jgi:hypothetical protein
MLPKWAALCLLLSYSVAFSQNPGYPAWPAMCRGSTLIVVGTVCKGAVSLLNGLALAFIGSSLVVVGLVLR